MPFEQYTPQRFDASSIQNYAPVASGVYGVSNSREWIYIGETSNIQSALMEHLRNTNTDLMRKQPTGFVFEVSNGSNRPARHERLVLEYGPVLNRSVARPR
jgi:hypothetical protein